MSFRVIDSHVHFPSSNIVEKPEKGSKDQWIASERERWRKAWNFPEVEYIEDRNVVIEKWYKEVLKYDLKKVVFVTSGGNEKAVEIVKRHPDRFIAYAHHKPDSKDAAQVLEHFIKEKGLRGYKILAPTMNTPISDRSLNPVWEVAQSLDIPVLIHFGIMGSAGGIANHVNINPLILHDVAKAFPNLKFIIPHFGCGYIFETLNLCWACPNVFVDTSGSNQWMRWMPYEVNLEILFRKYRETIGPTRIIFGTDSSWFPRGFANVYLEEQVRSMLNIGMSYEEVDKVLYSNIANLLKLKDDEQ